MNRTMDAPWLDHLRRDRRGIPVPYVNRWGKQEQPGKLVIQFDPLVKDRAVFYHDTDEREPDFTAQNMQRQRECMVRGLCQVCGIQIPWSRRFLVLSGMSTEVIGTPGPLKGSTLVVEPWLDLRCARFAIEHCPALIRRDRADDLTLHQVPGRRDAAIVVSKGWIQGPLEEETRADPVVMWAKLALRNLLIVPLGAEQFRVSSR